jgi:hypothetical protein
MGTEGMICLPSFHPFSPIIPPVPFCDPSPFAILFFGAKQLQWEGADVKTIHKYPLDTDNEDKITVMMPRVAKIVMVGSQNGEPFLWAIVDSESPLIARHYRLIATGEPIPGGHTHVASFTRNNGESTWHLFQ